MRVFPKPGDSKEVVDLMNAIEQKWTSAVSLRKQADAAEVEHNFLRADLRLLMEDLKEGDTVTLHPQGHHGIVEKSSDSPYLYVRLLDKSGNKAKRRIAFAEGVQFTKNGAQ